MVDEIVHRFPETGVADLRLGSQVIVRESQAAVFFRDGKALDVLGPGRHTIGTANVPLLTDLLGKLFGDRTPFTAEVYYVAMREFADRKWGTPQPIIVRNTGVGLGIALLQGFGTYSFQVSDPQQFVSQVVGQLGGFRTSDIENRLRTMLLSRLQDVLGETTAQKNVLDLIGLTDELGAAVRAKAQDDFLALGLLLNLSISAILNHPISQPKNYAIWACSIWRPTRSFRQLTQCVTRLRTLWRRWFDRWYRRWHGCWQYSGWFTRKYDPTGTGSNATDSRVWRR